MRPGRQTTPDASPEPLPVKVKTERPEPAVSASSQLNNTVPIDSHSQSNKGAASVQSKPKNKSSLGTREGMQGRRDIAIKEEDGEGGHEEEEGSTDGREQPLEEKDKEVNTTKTTDDGSKTRKAKNDSLSEAKDCSREEETVDDNHERGSGDKEGSTSANSADIPSTSSNPTSSNDPPTGHTNLTHDNSAPKDELYLLQEKYAKMCEKVIALTNELSKERSGRANDLQHLATCREDITKLLEKRKELLRWDESRQMANYVIQVGKDAKIASLRRELESAGKASDKTFRKEVEARHQAKENLEEEEKKNALWQKELEELRSEQERLPKEYESLQLQHETLREEYEELRRDLSKRLDKGPRALAAEPEDTSPTDRLGASRKRSHHELEKGVDKVAPGAVSQKDHGTIKERPTKAPKVSVSSSIQSTSQHNVGDQKWSVWQGTSVACDQAFAGSNFAFESVPEPLRPTKLTWYPDDLTGSIVKYIIKVEHVFCDANASKLDRVYKDLSAPPKGVPEATAFYIMFIALARVSQKKGVRGSRNWMKVTRMLQERVKLVENLRSMDQVWGD